MFKIKPKAGLIIRDPDTFEPLSETGQYKPKTSYWLNHLKQGDVEQLEDIKEKKTQTAETLENPTTLKTDSKSRSKGEK